LNQLERHWIKTIDTIYPNGYNLNRGGSGISKGQSIEVNGVKHPSISEAAREYNISERLVSDRLRYGWSIEQAFDLAVAPDSQKCIGKTISITHNGIFREFISIAELARYFNLPTARVMQRLVKLKWTPEAAVDLIPPPKRYSPKHKFKILVDGSWLTFESKKQAATHFGFKHWGIVDKRLKRRWNTEQALNLAPAPFNRFSPLKIKVKINGRSIEYSSQTEAAKANGVCFKRASARVKLGWSYEEALEIIPRQTKT